MQAFNPPWALLLSQLRRSDDARLSEAALTATGADVERLVRSKLLRRANNDYEPPECVHRCTPNLDHNSRQKEGLVGVACPHDVACWPGWTTRTSLGCTTAARRRRAGRTS